ncbi:reverse transcriptase-like protein [Candidatus Saccharibacteria bacterium]|nr:reverse transcriptase-like protein [Candidatus Saccharibacteria bacterium]
MEQKQKSIKITYKNHRGEIDDREVTPVNIWFGSTEWHSGEQWFLKAYDFSKGAERDFALADIQGVQGLQQTEFHNESSKSIQEKYPKVAKLYADGGSRGNPGPSAGGYAILDMADNVVKSNGKYLGITTNNQAEYHSLKGGVEMALELGIRELHVYMDSLLVINQMKGIYKIRNKDLWPIHDAIKNLIAKFEKITFTHVPRELNKLADSLVNEALDANINK